MIRTFSLFLAGLALAFAVQHEGRAAAPLRVCADPANMPFSDERQRGFENQLARLAAEDLGTTVAYTWHRQRSAFLDETLLQGRCDVVIGYPSHVQQVATTEPYYRSAYVWVARRSRRLRVSSYDDPVLATLRIGVQFSGDDASSPPAQALGRRGLGAGHLVGFVAPVNETDTRAPSAIIGAVASGAIDLAAAWGPLAGYYAAQQSVPLSVTPITPQFDGRMPQAFDISMAVRRDDARLLRQLNGFISRNASAINGVLDRYHVPRVRRPPS